MFTDPYAKLCFTALAASSFEKTIYIDLDTTFTAYLQSGMIKVPGKVDVMLPSEGRLGPMLKDTLASEMEGSIVIFDSVNSFYNLFQTRDKNLGKLNHLLSIMLMLIVKRGADAGAPVMATSMVRYRQDRGWVQSPASRRLLQTKSAVKMKIDIRPSGDLALTILGHDVLPAGSEIIFNSSAVTA